MLEFIKLALTRILVVYLLLIPLGVSADGIGFTNFKIVGSGTKYKAVTGVDYDLTNYLQNALENGVALKARVQFRLIIDRGWWFNKEITLHTVNFQLKYHALSQHYLLTRNDTNEHWNFSGLPAALRKLGELRQYTLPNIQKSENGNSYTILAVADMSPETLRLPLRIQSLFSDRYSIASEGLLWPLP